jgi:hypothetical protein
MIFTGRSELQSSEFDVSDVHFADLWKQERDTWNRSGRVIVLLMVGLRAGSDISVLVNAPVVPSQQVNRINKWRHIPFCARFSRPSISDER